MKSMQTLAAVAAGLAISLTAAAQEQPPRPAAPVRTGRFRSLDQMFRKTIWRQVDLREKQNKPMFSEGKESAG